MTLRPITRLERIKLRAEIYALSVVELMGGKFRHTIRAVRHGLIQKLELGHFEDEMDS